MSRKRQDLTGLKFNKLTAIKYITSNKFGSAIWLFKCDCGVEKEYNASLVRNGNTKSCGCIQQTKYQDLIGKKFGRLTLIKFSKRDKRGAQIYLCECECGKKKEIRVSDILCGTKSCGCQRSISKTINLTGKKYNKLTAIKFSKKIKNCRMWLWKCDCGNIKEISSAHVKNGHTTSCGCSNPSKWQGYKDITGSYFNSAKSRSLKRNLDFTISKEYIWKLFQKQKGICAISGVPITLIGRKAKELQTGSLDRIDSSKGYIKGNVQWLHKYINIMKQDMTDKEFIDWCEIITDFNKGKKND